jgi:tetratricopeptide (TPR) repeat protein
MSKISGFAELRRELDDAITYGTKKEALTLAARGLKAAKERKSDGETEYFLAQKYIIRGECAMAIPHLDAAIVYNPQDGAAYNDRALCMVGLGIIDEAFRYFDEGIRVEPDYATIHHNKGWLLNNIGRHSEAVGCFREALALEPGRAVTYDNLADALYNLSDPEGALAAYRRVLELLERGRCRNIRRQVEKRVKELEREVCRS